MISVRNLSLSQGSFLLDNVSFDVPTGKYAILMGKTGCGKTSILEAIAGLRAIRTGSIVLADHEVSNLPPAGRGIGYVPQDGALFPTMTIREHLAFALMLRGAPAADIERRVVELAEWLHISALLNRLPAGLSGGEAQRVALGRALSFHPRFLLMDEPLSSLDESTRGQLIELLKDIRQRHETTVLHVTHSQWEADQLAECLLRLENGRVMEVK